MAAEVGEIIPRLSEKMVATPGPAVVAKKGKVALALVVA